MGMRSGWALLATQPGRSLLWMLSIVIFYAALPSPLAVAAEIEVTEKEQFSAINMATRTRDYASAAALLVPLAEQGNHKAQYQLAALYRAGRGVTKRDELAYQWFEKSANQGNAKAQYALAKMYESGRGVGADEFKAIFWYRKAADQNHPMAKSRLSRGTRMARQNADDLDRVREQKSAIEKLPLEQRLHFAARVGDINNVRVLLTRDVNPNQQDRFGKTPLMAAVTQKKHAVAKLLLKFGVDTEIKDIYQNTALLIACSTGDDAIVGELLKHHANVSAVDGNGNTSLMIAAGNGFLEISRALIEKGAVVDARNKNGDTALSRANKKPHQRLVALLKTFGAEPDLAVDSTEQARLAALQKLTPRLSGASRTSNGGQAYRGWSSVMIAAERGQGDVVRQLLSKGADANSRDEDGVTALSLAVAGGHPVVVRTLIAAGAAVDAQDRHGKTALMIAAAGGNGALLRALLAAGANPDIQQKNGQTALLTALEEGQPTLAMTLLNGGADAAQSTARGVNTLMLAAGHAYLAVMNTVLIANGAMVDVQESDQRTALWYAADAGQGQAVDLLVDRYGADLERADQQGVTPLARAVWRGHENVVASLLGWGADANVRNATGDTLLMLAAGKNRQAIAKLLFEVEVPLDEKNSQGNTALMLAVAGGHRDMVKLLLVSGANPDIKNNNREQARKLAEVYGYHDMIEMLDRYRSSKSHFFGLF